MLVAPDSFKGSFAAKDVAAQIARGLREGGRETVELPIADGGEGTLDALLTAFGGERRSAPASDPLGRPLEASFALTADGRRAIVEVAEASGLGRLSEGERDAFAASSRGTGELIVAAAEAGAETVILAAGGSATSDGGAGAIEAIRQSGTDPQVVVVCDVRTPFERAARVYGPQKGADAATVRRLERRLERLAAAAPRDPRGVPLTGCAGGLSGGMWAYLGARLVPGASFVLDEVGFDAPMSRARFVVTGEGRLDRQTLEGKAVGEVATRCRQAGIACHAVVGVEALERFGERIIDLASVREARTLADLAAAGRRLAAL